MALSTAEELWLELRQQDSITVQSAVKAATRRGPPPSCAPLPTPELRELLSGRLPPWVQQLWEQMKADESAASYRKQQTTPLAETQRSKKRARCSIDDLTEMAMRQCNIDVNECTTLAIWGPPKLLLTPRGRPCSEAKRARTRAHPATREHLDALTRLVSEM